MSKKITLIIITLLTGCLAIGQEFIPIWPEGRKPNFNGKVVTDTLYNERIWRVGTPGMYVFDAGIQNAPAIMIIPGGGYQRISHIHNGFNLAKWYNSIGMSAFVLIYRLPHQEDLQHRQLAPLQDAQRALNYIRSNASKWKINSSSIGVMGTSAGGHLAALLGNTQSLQYTPIDDYDTAGAKPDFMVLLSPVISMGKITHAGSKRNFLGKDTAAGFISRYSNELNVHSRTPKTFIAHALDDSTVSVRNSLVFYNALLDGKINSSLHIFPNGGHNISTSGNPGSTALWLDLLQKWLKETGILNTQEVKTP